MGIFSKLFGRREQIATSPGQEFVEQLFADLYPGQAARIAVNDSDPRPAVKDVHTYDGGDSWHYVTIGLTSLFKKSGPSPDVSGFGYELSMRVRKRGSEEPPLWPVALLNLLAQHVRQGATVAQAVSFRTGRIEDAPPDENHEGVVALLDPLIEPAYGPFGRVGVMLLVGLAGPELDAIQQGGGARLIQEIAAEPARWTT